MSLGVDEDVVGFQISVDVVFLVDAFDRQNLYKLDNTISAA